MGNPANFIKTFMKKIQPNRLEDVKKAKSAEKSLLSYLKDVGKAYEDDNPLNNLKQDVNRFYCGLEKAVFGKVTNITSGKRKKFKEKKNTDMKGYNLSAFYLGIFIESYIDKSQKISLEDWSNFSGNLADRIDGIIKLKKIKQKELRTEEKEILDFMTNKKVKNELKKAMNVFKSHKDKLSKIESGEKERLQGEFKEIFSLLNFVDSSADISQLKTASTNLWNGLIKMTFLKEKNLKEEKIFNSSNIGKAVDICETVSDLIKSILEIFEHDVQRYREADINSDNYLLCKDFIEKEFFNKFKKHFEDLLKEVEPEHQ